MASESEIMNKQLKKLILKQKKTKSKGEWMDLEMEIGRLSDDLGAVQSGFWGD